MGPLSKKLLKGLSQISTDNVMVTVVRCGDLFKGRYRWRFDLTWKAICMLRPFSNQKRALVISWEYS
jgi:hypothetical protein